jgi:hypothetical protein
MVDYGCQPLGKADPEQTGRVIVVINETVFYNFY